MEVLIFSTVVLTFKDRESMGERFILSFIHVALKSVPKVGDAPLPLPLAQTDLRTDGKPTSGARVLHRAPSEGPLGRGVNKDVTRGRTGGTPLVVANKNFFRSCKGADFQR